MATQLWRRVCYVLSMLLNPDPLTEQVIGCAINVHRALGPGSLESAYRRCFSHELTMQGIAFKSEVAVPIVYRGARIECGYRADIVIKEKLLLELKAVDVVLPIHHAQVITYLKLLHLKQGLLMNFNSKRLVDGLKSFLV
jgi:GxxExxY protein